MTTKKPDKHTTPKREQFQRNYLKEEEFLDEYPNLACEASALMGDEWRPDWNCNDARRKQHKHFRSTGEMTWLVFDGAAVLFDDNNHFSSVSISLTSSKRDVTIKVSRQGDKWVAEKTLDRTADERPK